MFFSSPFCFRINTIDLLFDLESFLKLAGDILGNDSKAIYQRYTNQNYFQSEPLVVYLSREHNKLQWWKNISLHDEEIDRRGAH